MRVLSLSQLYEGNADRRERFERSVELAPIGVAEAKVQRMVPTVHLEHLFHCFDSGSARVCWECVVGDGDHACWHTIVMDRHTLDY